MLLLFCFVFLLTVNNFVSLTVTIDLEKLSNIFSHVYKGLDILRHKNLECCTLLSFRLSNGNHQNRTRDPYKPICAWTNLIQVPSVPYKDVSETFNVWRHFRYYNSSTHFILLLILDLFDDTDHSVQWINHISFTVYTVSKHLIFYVANYVESTLFSDKLDTITMLSSILW